MKQINLRQSLLLLTLVAIFLAVFRRLIAVLIDYAMGASWVAIARQLLFCCGDLLWLFNLEWLAERPEIKPHPIDMMLCSMLFGIAVHLTLVSVLISLVQRVARLWKYLGEKQ